MATEIATMSIRAGNGTCLVLKKDEEIHMGNPHESVPKVSLSRVDLSYDDGKSFSFYIEDRSLLNFIREAINMNHFKSHIGEHIPLI